jgi:hypothetical protein
MLPSERLLFSPLGRATENTCVLHCHFPVLEEGIDGIAGLMGLYQFRAVAIVHEAFIAEAAATIKDKDMRSSLRTKRSRYRLNFAVVEV